MIETLLTFAGGALGLELVRRGFDTYQARRASAEKRTETTATADATVKTKRIDDAAALRGELRERIEKLEKRSDDCMRENGELREEIGKLRSDIEHRDCQIEQRDSVISQLTQDVEDLRGRAQRAEQKAEDAERRTNALREELDEFRRQVA